MPEPMTDVSAWVLLDEQEQRAEMVDRLIHRPVWGRVAGSLAVGLAASAGFGLLTTWGAGSETTAAMLSVALVGIVVLTIGQAHTDRRIATLVAILERSGTFDAFAGRRAGEPAPQDGAASR